MKKRTKTKTKKYKLLNDYTLFGKVLRFTRYVSKDIYHASKDKSFNDYGIRLYCGAQGSGKSISLTLELERIRHEFPDVPIYTNFGYVHETGPLTDWQQILELRNDAGIVFAIDEIQNEFDVYASRDFNIRLLRTVTQQRKQKIRILATAQQFNRVTKPLREQTFEVVECVTLMGRWTFQKCFDAVEYNTVIDNPEKKQKLRRLWRKNFVQDESIRNLYDSYAVIRNMAQLEKMERSKELKLIERMVENANAV